MNYRKDIERLGWKKAEHKKDMEALYEVSQKEGRAFNEDEQAKFNELKANCKTIDSQLENAHELMHNEEQDSQIVTDDNQVVQEKAADKTQEPEKFMSFGEQLLAVRGAAIQGGAIDPRLALGAASGLSEGIGSEGGFLVQTDFINELIKPIFDGGAIISRVKQVNIGAGFNGTKINAVNETSRKNGSRWGGVQAFWDAESATKTKSKPEFRQIEINLKKLIGLAYATDELLQDSVALESVIRQAFTDEFTFVVEDAIVEGTGAGQPLGVMNSGAKLQISKETGQAAKTVIAENIEKIYARMPSRSLSNAIWTINQDVWPQIFQLHHAVGTGGVPVFIPASSGIVGSPAGTLLGRPIVPTEYNETLGTAGDIMFADYSQYLFGHKGTMESASSIHVRFINDETTFRFVWRVDGQPIPESPITPFKGTTTQSPFVVLASRT